MQFHQKPNTFVSHVELKVSNIAESIAFYKQIVGFQILEQTENNVRFTTDGKSSILSLKQLEKVEPKQQKTTGLYHFAILLPERKDLANFVFHLAKNKIPVGSSNHLVSEAFYFNDPDGNGIEVYADKDPSTWTWRNNHVVMAVDPIDIEGLLAEGENGAWTLLPTNTVMGHIHLHVAELGETKRFYEEGLGFQTVSQFGNQALFISTGKYHHHIGLNTWNGVGAPPELPFNPGLESYTLSYPNKESLEQVVNNVRQIGAKVERDNDNYVTYDPSQNKIVLSYEAY
jgi:catechol 2,3-dioxygenase